MGKVAYHIEKGVGNAGGLGHHIDRTKGKEFSYKDADLDRLHLNQNYNLNKFCSMPLEKAIEERIKEGYKSNRKIRENTIRYTSHILSSDEKTMKDIFSNGQGDEWVKANFEFLKDEYGEENIVRFALHMDETTPHLHAIIIPLTKDGRLSAKEIIGNRKSLQDKQTKYAKYMEPFGLERGVLGSKATHENIQDYRRRINQAEELIKKPETKIKASLGLVKESVVKSIQEDNKALKSLVIDSKEDLKREQKERKKETFILNNQIEKIEKEKAVLLGTIEEMKTNQKDLLEIINNILIDEDYRNAIFTDRLLQAEKTIRKEMKILSSKVDIAVSHIDDLIRKFVKNVTPKLDVWRIMDKFYPKEKGRMESNLFNYSLKLNEERKESLKIDNEPTKRMGRRL